MRALSFKRQYWPNRSMKDLMEEKAVSMNYKLHRQGKKDAVCVKECFASDNCSECCTLRIKTPELQKY